MGELAQRCGFFPIWEKGTLMPDYELAIRSSRVVTPDGERAATVLVRDGRIAGLAEHSSDARAVEVVDLGADALMPGLVDTHVHINEPGRTETEGFATATRAAAAGGVTTILDMPNGSIPPTTSVEALEIKRSAASGQCSVDVGFWGGAVAGNQDALVPLLEAGVFGFKGYLFPESDSFPYLGGEQLDHTLEVLKTVDGLLLVHAEDAEEIAKAAPALTGSGFSSFLASRPASAETAAIRRVIAGSRSTGTKVHVVHLSAADALADIRAAKEEGVRLTVETCPHYLAITAGEIPDGATQYKCTPPIREEGNREALWSALSQGVIDCVVSDHAPCTVEAKYLDTGDFDRAGPGIASLQLSLSIVWTEADERGHSLTDVARWMATNTARFADIDRKGAIAEGYDADLVWFAPDASYTVDAKKLLHRNPITAYQGRSLRGVVRRTWLRGRAVDVDGTPHGELLRKNTA